MQRIIGGMFGLEESTYGSFPPFIKGCQIFLINARSGLSLLVELLSPAQVWLPSYLCDVVLKAVNKNATLVRFYEVNYDLEINSLQWLENVQKGDLVLLIDYFGFLYSSDYAIRAKEQGAWVVEDACQALLSADIGSYSDFVLFSPRKFLGVPDGGLLALNDRSEPPDIPLGKPPASWWLKAFCALVLRREFDLHGGGRLWFKLFQESEAQGPVGKYSMSELSMMLLKNNFDYSKIIQKRIENFQTLNDSLAPFAIFQELSSGTVPLGFPIRIKERDRVRQVLFQHEIYPAIHWKVRNIVPEEFKESHKLADDIMTLPCDQRYNREDMELMAQLVLKEVRQ